MTTREEALAYGLSFPDTYQEAPFHDDNWQIDFKNSTDYDKVMDYLDNEKEEDILKYARDKEFWEKLIWG